MSTSINARAASTREQSREADGKFGQQGFTQAVGMELDSEVSAVDVLEWPDGFDPHTAAPTRFDAQCADEYTELSRAVHSRDIVLSRLHRDVGDCRAGTSRQQRWGMSDDDVLARARSRSDTVRTPGEVLGARTTRSLLESHEDATSHVAAARERVDALNEEYAARGGWNRAFLVANDNGHVHSSTHCSTCRPTTQYAWMTEYSGAEEDQVVQDAGYRACTTCYPSAPLGDEITLPTTILTREEKDAADQRTGQQEQREAKKMAAAANAPTASGEPIEIRYPSGRSTYVETLKTERTAQQWVTSHLVDLASLHSRGAGPTGEVQKQEIEREATQRVIDSLAEKRGVDRADVVEEVRKKAIAKATRDHREGMKHARALGVPVDSDAEDRHARALAYIAELWDGRD